VEKISPLFTAAQRIYKNPAGKKRPFGAADSQGKKVNFSSKRRKSRLLLPLNLANNAD
jgi:hypothetical protein